MALGASPTRRQGDIAFAAILLATAVVSFIEASGYPGGSGVYPRVLALMLAVGAALVILRCLRRQASEPEERFFVHGGRFLLAIASLVIYVGAVDILGYLIPSLAVTVGLPLFLGYRNLKLSVPLAVGTVTLIVLVFFVALERPLPPDVFDPILEMLR